MHRRVGLEDRRGLQRLAPLSTHERLEACSSHRNELLRNRWCARGVAIQQPRKPLCGTCFRSRFP